MTIDWNQLMDDADSFSLAPPGEYDMIVHSAEGTTYGTGSQGIKAVFMFENGPHVGQKVFNNFVLAVNSDKAAQVLGFFFKNMKTLGLDSDFFAKNPQLDEVAQALVGRRARIVLEHRKWNDDLQYSVKSIKPPNGAATGVVASSSSSPSVPTMNPSSPSVPSASKVPVVPKTPSVSPPVPPSI